MSRFPDYRPRRLRRTPALRRLVRETRLDPAAFVLPLFVRSGTGVRAPVSSMPGVAQTSVDELLRDAEALIAPQCVAKGLALTVAPCPAGAAARADADKLQQILLNLLSNAVKFTPSGGQVTIECVAVASGVVLHVRDTGIGIPDDKLAHVFEAFVQLDQRLTRVAEGIGLGLAVSRELARGEGGALAAEGIVSPGSTFPLTLAAA